MRPDTPYSPADAERLALENAELRRLLAQHERALQSARELCREWQEHYHRARKDNALFTIHSGLIASGPVKSGIRQELNS